MNQKPGTLMGMLSCHRPPRYHAGSLGVRLIMAPPVETSMRSAKMPCGPSTALMMSISGRCAQRLGPIDGRHLRRQVEQLRGADEIFLRGVGRKHGAHLVLLAVDPGDEEHLHRAAAVPVALLEVGGHAAHARAEALRDHGRERRVALRGDAQLPFRGGRAADSAHLAVGPRLLRPSTMIASVPSESGAPRMS